MSQQGVRLSSCLVFLFVVLGFSLPARATTVTYSSPMVNGYYVGTLYPATGSSAADTARRFCQDNGYVSALKYATSIRSTAYSFVNGTGGVGPWSTTGNANVTMLDAITCDDVPVTTYSSPMVNGYYVGTIYPATGSSAADTARRFCQDNGYASSQGYTTSIRSTAYSFINGTGGVGPWSVTGNSNVTMLDTIICASP